MPKIPLLYLTHHIPTDTYPLGTCTCTDYTEIHPPLLYFANNGSSGIHAKDTNFIFGTPQLHTYAQMT